MNLVQLDKLAEIPHHQEYSAEERHCPRKARRLKPSYALAKFSLSLTSSTSRQDLPLLFTMHPAPLPSHFPCRPHILSLPANNCSWLIAAPTAARALRACASFQARHATYGIRKCFLFLLQCQLTLVVIQVSPGLAGDST